MEFKDYYKTLGVDKSTSAADIKKAYRRLAIKYHPDKNKGDKTAESKFKEISEAYEVLGNPEKKQKYDNLGSSYNSYRQTGGNPGDFNWNDWVSSNQRGRTSARTDSFGDMFDSGGGLSDFFENIFGRSGAQRKTGKKPSKAGNTHVDLEITLEDAFHGKKHSVVFNSQRIDITTKPGIREGQQLRIPGKGKIGAYGLENGDLIINVKIIPNPNIVRKNDDLYMTADIDLYKAILGGTEQVNTFRGDIKITIPPECANGKTLKLKGLGMPNYSNPENKGNLYVKLNVLMPENLSELEKELFVKLRDLREDITKT